MYKDYFLKQMFVLKQVEQLEINKQNICFKLTKISKILEIFYYNLLDMSGSKVNSRQTEENANIRSVRLAVTLLPPIQPADSSKSSQMNSKI
jgi:hypothetical protein